MKRHLWCLAVLAGLAGCASPPEVRRDIAAAQRDAAHSPGGVEGMRIEGEKLAQNPFLPGNSVQLLVNGPASYTAMMQAIGGARRRIDMESYQFDQAEGGKFADLLLLKRREGVEINLIYDAWGSFETPAALFDRLRRAGVHVLEYNPLDPTAKVPLDLNRRDHRKLLVVDDAVAITGGVNVSDVYENRRNPPGKDPDPDRMVWRDTDVRIEGPVVGQFDRLFMETWRAQKGPPIPAPPPAPPDRPGSSLVQAIDGAPDDRRPLIYRTLMVAIALARRSVHLTTGFFVPTPDLAKALERAARRGIDVEIVVPSESDSSLSIAAGRSDYGELLRAGVRIFERKGAVLHAKTAVIDGTWSAVGSSNLDWRSVLYNNEIDAVIIDPVFGREMEAQFARDVAASREIDLRAWADRSLIERLDELAGNLLGFLL